MTAGSAICLLSGLRRMRDQVPVYVRQQQRPCVGFLLYALQLRCDITKPHGLFQDHLAYAGNF